jgi:hypothetical protein
MKAFNFFTLALLFVSVGLWSGCEESCTPHPNPEIGFQSFTVEYLDPDGTNYLNSIYNRANLTVYADFDGGTRPSPEFVRFDPGYENGKFGPFRYTEAFYDSATFTPNPLPIQGRAVRYDYYIEKDTFGTDKFTVEFRLAADECGYYWAYIRYFRNDEPLPEYENEYRANIQIIE